MRLISAVFPALPGFPTSQTFAPWPVRRDSVRGEVKFQPLTKQEAVRRWEAACRHESETTKPGSGKHGGALGHLGLLAYNALLFKFSNRRTGQLDPSQAEIARAIGCSRRGAITALARLRDLRLISWQRRCQDDYDAAGRFRLRQRSNAYNIEPTSHWLGYRDPPPRPPKPWQPKPWQWGAVPPLPDEAETALATRAAGGSVESALPSLLTSPDPLAVAIGGLFADIVRTTPGT